MKRAASDGFEADMVAWGKVVVLETVGRVSGRTRRATIGFSEEADGALLIAAGDAASQWARNLIEEPDCAVERAGTRQRYRAERIHGAAAHAAVAQLILKYGTPAERLGAGPAFRLRPLTG